MHARTRACVCVGVCRVVCVIAPSAIRRTAPRQLPESPRVEFCPFRLPLEQKLMREQGWIKHEVKGGPVLTPPPTLLAEYGVGCKTDLSGWSLACPSAGRGVGQARPPARPPVYVHMRHAQQHEPTRRCCGFYPAGRVHGAGTGWSCSASSSSCSAGSRTTTGHARVSSTTSTSLILRRTSTHAPAKCQPVPN